MPAEAQSGTSIIDDKELYDLIEHGGQSELVRLACSDTPGRTPVFEETFLARSAEQYGEECNEVLARQE